ncbi:MAG TPA: DUF3822 family protein [Bacteroidia bacterium]|nr:DUF3822 family protein [Bacteroidia bacterium]
MTANDSGVTVLADAQFSPEDTILYDLMVSVGEDHVAALLYKHAEKMIAALEYYPINEKEGNNASLFNQISEQSTLLSGKGYRKAACLSAFRSNTLVPNPLFTEINASDYLSFSNQTASETTVIADVLHQIDAHNVHAIPEWLHSVLSLKFPGVIINHRSSALIDYLTSLNKNSGVELMVADITREYIELVVTRGNKLLLHNTYKFENAEGLVYFILFACEQLQLNPESVCLRFSGQINSENPAYKLAHKYIRDTGFMEKPDLFTYSDAFSEIPEQTFFSLFTQVLCVS